MAEDTFLFNIYDHYQGTVVVKAPTVDIAYDTLEVLLRRFRQDPQTEFIDREIDLDTSWSSEDEWDPNNEHSYVDFDFYEWIRNPEFEAVLDNSSVGYRQFLADTLRLHSTAINREKKEAASNDSVVFCNDIY